MWRWFSQPKSVNIKRLDPNHELSEAEDTFKDIFDNEHNNNNGIDTMKLRTISVNSHMMEMLPRMP